MEEKISLQRIFSSSEMDFFERVKWSRWREREAGERSGRNFQNKSVTSTFNNVLH